MKKTAALTLSVVLLSSFSAFAAEPERVWKSKCASCHGKDGTGDTKKGKQMAVADMTTAAWQKEFTDAKIVDATKKGVKREKDGKKQEMDGFESELSAEEIDGLVKVMRGFKK